MTERHKVSNYLDFVKFNYVSEFDSDIELGDIVYRKLSDGQEEIGVIIQTYGNGEFHTDMFGNTNIKECSFARLKLIERIRPELLTKLKQK
jgi:hypothetical protein